jgi:uncharacterized LabA/DUF88 family protein
MYFQVGINIDRLGYFTSVVGDEDETQKVRVLIRSLGFEPKVMKEVKELARRREENLIFQLVLEKPKGVDIGLAIRVLEDAYRNVFQECVIVTSDLDFLPLIQAVQRLGKRVSVAGFRSGLGKSSALEYVPDIFHGLGE